MRKGLTLNWLFTKLNLADYYSGKSLSLLIVPKRHVISISDLTKREYVDLSGMIAYAVAVINGKIEPIGLTILYNEGNANERAAQHIQFHVIAREPGDGLGNLDRINDKKPITNDQLSEVKSLF